MNAKPLRAAGKLRHAAASALAACMLFVAAPAVQAQRGQDEGSVQRFINDVGATLYFFAWPSATYKRVSFNGLTQAPRGFDARVTLYGTSAFDGSDLWTELILEVRDGQIRDLKWGRHNAQLFRPGESISAFGELLVELNRQYSAGSPNGSPTPRATPGPESILLSAVCVSNPTSVKLAYAIDWSGQRDQRALEPGEAMLYWAGQTSPVFSVTFDNNFDPGYTPRTVRLKGSTRRAAPTKCGDVAEYQFVTDGRAVGLAPTRWQAGFEHPFFAAVLADAKQGSWMCAPGHKWASNDTKHLECIPSNMGLVGVSLTQDAGVPFPRIVSIAPGSPAERSGLTAGLLLISVGQASTQDRPLAEITQMVRGTVGTTVRVGVASAGAPSRIVTLTRE